MGAGHFLHIFHFLLFLLAIGAFEYTLNPLKRIPKCTHSAGLVCGPSWVILFAAVRRRAWQVPGGGTPIEVAKILNV